MYKDVQLSCIKTQNLKVYILRENNHGNFLSIE